MRFYALTVLAFSTLVFGQNPALDNEWEDFIQRFDKNYELGGDEELVIIFFVPFSISLRATQLLDRYLNRLHPVF